VSIPGFQAEPALAGGERFGPNSVEVGEFVRAAGRLTAAQWRRVLAIRRAGSTVVRDAAAQPAASVRALLHGASNGAATLGEPMAAVATELGSTLQDRSDEEVAAAWQAVSALVRRRQLQALTFAAHYLPFASILPPVAGPIPPSVELFARSLKWLNKTQWESLARAWSVEREAGTALLQAAARMPARESEEAVALAALAMVPRHLTGDAGWAAVKTAVHGARVLACRSELTPEQLQVLWAPLEEALPLRSLEAPPPATEATPMPARPPRAKRPSTRRGSPYGANSAEVTAFLKAVRDLTAIQWLRVLDRRQLVASVTREGSSEPAAVVRAILAAITASRGLDLDVRCRIVAAVQRAGYALAGRQTLSDADARAHYGALEEVLPYGQVDTAGLAGFVAALNPEEWARLAGVAPEVDQPAMAPLVHAGDALAEMLTERTDEEAVTAWQALTALLSRYRLSPIKFAASYAPFASAAPVTKPRAIGPAVQRYLTAVGRLSAHQCSLLAEPWMLADDISNALSAAVVGGSARGPEEAAALTALVTVPMRLTGDAGWAAAKTAVYGARVIASRGKVAAKEFEALWKPLERAIPLDSLEVRRRSKS
jgi:hypothetical protein